jgi:hypothetical protein
MPSTSRRLHFPPKEDPASAGFSLVAEVCSRRRQAVAAIITSLQTATLAPRAFSGFNRRVARPAVAPASLNPFHEFPAEARLFRQERLKPRG